MYQFLHPTNSVEGFPLSIESVPRQVDRRSGVPEGGERGLGLSRRRCRSGILKEEERTNGFFLHSFVRII